MKIGIFTLPLNTNYGGILQAYALQTVLQRMGHEVVLLERKNDVMVSTGIKNRLVNIITRCLFKKESLKLVIWEQVDKFKKENINLIQVKHLEDYLNTINLDAYIVGSDQVWRPIWKENYIPDYFLEFAKDNSLVKKIAYAASFAVDEWEFSNEETKRYAPLVKLFDAVSVREASGINLCKKYFNISAVQMLDPTLLLDKLDYEKLVMAKKEKIRSNQLFSYILDDSPYKQRVIRCFEKKLNISSFKLSNKSCHNVFQLIFAKKRYQVASVTKWLKAFMDSEYVITDSFHGCVFSIIFNKPFWAIGNAGRGLARFTSLLEMFGLEDRMISASCDIDNFDFAKKINWKSVNDIKSVWQKKAIDFLTTNLLVEKV